MSTVNFVNPRARFSDADHKPLANGRVIFLEAGTSTLKGIYSDAAGTQLAESVNLLDDQGFVEDATGVHLGQGKYDIRVQYATGLTPIDPRDPDDPAWSDFWTYPDIDGVAAGSGANLDIGFVDTVENLRFVQAGAFDLIYVAGYYTAGDGSARWMRWNSVGTGDDNGGTIISPDGNPAIGRWDWVPNATDTVVTPQLFGAFPSDGSLVIASQMSRMITWCLANNYNTIEFNLDGDYWINSSSVFSGDLTVIIQEGVVFKSNNSVSLDFTCKELEVHGISQVVSPAPITSSVNMNINTYKSMDVRPEWWGVDPTAVFTSQFNFDIMSSSIASDHTIVLSKNYLLNGGIIDLSDNTVKFTEGTTISLEGCALTLGEYINNNSTPSLIGTENWNTAFTTIKADSDLFQMTDGSNVFLSNFLNNFIDLNTASGKIFTFVVNKGTYILDYDVTQATRLNYDHMRFLWEFEKDSNFEVASGGAIQFGSVEAGDYQIFSEDSVLYRMRFPHDVNLKWFGARPSLTDATTTAKNVKAVKLAYSVSSLSNAPTASFPDTRCNVKLNGGTFNIDQCVIPADTTARYEARFKNGRLIDAVPGAASTKVIDTPYGIVLDSTEITVDGFETVLTNQTRQVHVINNSRLQGRAKLIDSQSSEQLKIDNSVLFVPDELATDRELITHIGDNTVITNNTIKRSYVTATGVSKSTTYGLNAIISGNIITNVDMEAKDNATMSNNKIERGSLYCVDPRGATIEDNTLTTHNTIEKGIYLKKLSPPSASAPSQYSYLIRGNRFNPMYTLGRATYSALRWVDTNDNTIDGEGLADVYDNFADIIQGVLIPDNSIALGATRFRTQLSVGARAGGYHNADIDLSEANSLVNPYQRPYHSIVEPTNFIDLNVTCSLDDNPIYGGDVVGAYDNLDLSTSSYDKVITYVVGRFRGDATVPWDSITGDVFATFKTSIAQASDIGTV